MTQNTLPEKIRLKDASCIKQFELQPCNDWCLESVEEETYLNFYLPVTFDVDKALGLNVCTFENDDYVNLYLNWYPAKDSVELVVCYMKPTNDKAYDVGMSDAKRKEIKKTLFELCKKAYGKTPQELYEDEQKRSVSQ